MRRILSFVLAVVLIVGVAPVVGTPAAAAADPSPTPFSDPAFAAAVLALFPGKTSIEAVSDTEFAEVLILDVRSKGIKSLAGIERFTGLTKLICSDNQLTALDISKNTALINLSCVSNRLTALDVSKNTALQSLDCYENQLTALDISKNTALREFECSSNQLAALDVTKNTALVLFSCNHNQLTTLDVTKNTALVNLRCFNNQLTALDVTKNTALQSLDCYDNKLTALDFSNNTVLTYLNCRRNQLAALDLRNNTALREFECQDNQLTALDVSKNTALTRLICFNNKLAALDVTKNTALGSLRCENNRLTTLDISENAELKSGLFSCENNLMGDDPDVSVTGWRKYWTTADDNFPFRYHPQGPYHGIDYEGVIDVIVPGSVDGFAINLTQETLILPSAYTVAAYSIDGGTKWKPVKDALSAEKFPKLFNKDLTLQLSDLALDTAKGSNKGKPLPSANIVTFAKINKRQKALALAVNYLIGADATGATTGDWLFVPKAKGADITVAVKDGVQIGVANAAGKTVDDKGFGQFYPGLTNGIPVQPIGKDAKGKDKVQKAVYFIKAAAKPADASGAYTAASKPKKVTVSGQQKRPAFKVDPKKKLIKVKAGTIAQSADGTVTTYAAKGEITAPGTYDLWMAATAKKPASAKQPLTIS